ncbi:MAG TPA: hypothetical protein PKI51_05355 [Anaerolineaceae bacterium]|nr:hypothetical protein [Anaerolineaceae bacterium]
MDKTWSGDHVGTRFCIARGGTPGRVFYLVLVFSPSTFAQRVFMHRRDASAKKLNMVRRPCRNKVLFGAWRDGLTKPAIVFCYAMAGVMCGMKYAKA